MSQDAIKQRLDLAIKSAKSAGEITLKYYQQSTLQVETKSDESPVTIADRQAEEHLREEITKAFPEDAILGEEFPEKEGTSGFRWILDPIDGTKSFIHGVPLYGTLIGVEFESQPTIGVINHPPLNEMVYAMKGGGAWYVRNQQSPLAAKVSNVEKLSDSLFSTTSVKEFDKTNRREVYEQLLQTAKLSRGWGDCYGYTLVATGRAEVMVDPAMHVWDCAALMPIIEEAGGSFTDWQGTPTIHSEEAIATNGKILEEVLAITKGK